MNQPSDPKPPVKRTHQAEIYEDEVLQAIHASVKSEKAEPWEADSQMPFLLLLVFGLLCAWAGYYLSAYSAGFDSFIYDHNWRPNLAQKQVPKEWVPLVEGEKLFKNNCQQCHQSDGKGVPGSYPSLAGSEWLLGTQARPIRIILHGLQGPIEVHGQTFNGSMPNFGEKFDDKRVAAVLSYVRQAWGNKGEPITEEIVKQVRQTVGKRSDPWTAKELLDVKEITAPPAPTPSSPPSTAPENTKPLSTS